MDALVVLVAPDSTSINAGGESNGSATSRDSLATLEPRVTGYTTKLITGFEVTGAEGGLENDLMLFISRAVPADKTTWIGFDQVGADNSLSNGNADAQINNVAEILKAFQTLKLELGASGDGSQARADALRNALIAKGVAAERLTAKGYGADAPFATKPLYLDRAPTKGAALRVSER